MKIYIINLQICRIYKILNKKLQLKIIKLKNKKLNKNKRKNNKVIHKNNK